MVTSRLNHVSVLAHDLEESATFYEEVFGMERVPAPNFPGVEVEWLRVGDLTIHLFKREEMEPVGNYHFGLWVDDFESIFGGIDPVKPNFNFVGLGDDPFASPPSSGGSTACRARR